MKKRLDEKTLDNIVNETLKEFLNETSRRQKAVQSIKGNNRKVKSLCIISAENPMGVKASEEYNKASTEDLINNLRIGRYQYFVTKGKYGGEETSIMVYNISLDDSIKLCYKYNQESMVFVDMTSDNVSYQYWEGDDHNSPLKLQHEEHLFVDATNDDDFYTQISRNFKFRIPFFENVKKVSKILEGKVKQYDVDNLLKESMDSQFTGKHKYICRCKLWGKNDE